MLTIKNLHCFSIICVALLGIFTNCGEQKNQAHNTESTVAIDSAKEFYESEDKIVYDYHSFAGIYDHESNTKGFSAILSITESGNDLTFTISVAQGSCKGEAQGNIVMVSHEQTYYVGFYEFNECPLQFTLMLNEAKVDVKEVNLCRLHESSCAFEGSFAKRKI